MKKTCSDYNGTRTHNHLVRKRTLNHLDIEPVSSMEFLDIQAIIECRFTLKQLRDMIRTCSQEDLKWISYNKNQHLHPCQSFMNS